MALGHPASYPGAPSLGVKRPVREADHSPPSSAEIRECVELYLHSPIRLHGVVLSYSTGTTFTDQITVTALSHVHTVLEQNRGEGVKYVSGHVHQQFSVPSCAGCSVEASHQRHTENLI